MLGHVKYYFIYCVCESFILCFLPAHFPLPNWETRKKRWRRGQRSRHGSGQSLEWHPYFHHRQPDRGTAPSRKGMKCLSCKLGSEGLKGCVGGSHLYGQTSVYIKSVSLRDEIQSHGTDKEKMKASGPEDIQKSWRRMDFVPEEWLIHPSLRRLEYTSPGIWLGLGRSKGVLPLIYLQQK